jgi:hypothetical protein
MMNEGLVRGQSTMDGDHACTRLLPDFWSVGTHQTLPRSGRLITPGDKADIIVGIDNYSHSNGCKGASSTRNMSVHGVFNLEDERHAQSRQRHITRGARVTSWTADHAREKPPASCQSAASRRLGDELKRIQKQFSSQSKPKRPR